MYPILSFGYSYNLQSEILGSTSNFKKLEKFTKEFEKYFRKHEKKIIKNIELYTGFEWKIKDIDVWIFNGCYPSISFPLLLNWYKNNKKFALFSLIHELVHNILFLRLFITKKNSKKIDIIELEALVELITKYVSKNIFTKKDVHILCKRAEFRGEFKHVWDREKELERKIDLDKKPLKEWIKNYKFVDINDY